MNIKPMLMRLQSALKFDGLAENMLLLPGAAAPTGLGDSGQPIQLVVGYDASPESHTALDLTLWIAHQTRLVTQKPVVVRAVYVVEPGTEHGVEHHLHLDHLDRFKPDGGDGSVNYSGSGALQQTRPRSGSTALAPVHTRAAAILEQARQLAHEWDGYLETALQFGAIAEELRTVVETKSALLLFLGCRSVNHPLIQQLGANFPCPVLGLPESFDPKLD